MLWWFGVFFIAIHSHEGYGVKTLNIGAIFSLQTVSGRTSEIAIKAAVDDINSDPSVLGGRQLALHIHDSNSSGFLSIMGVHGDGHCGNNWPSILNDGSCALKLGKSTPHSYVVLHCT